MKSKYLIFLLLVCMLASSCEKYLDVKSSSATSIIRNASDCQLLLNDYGNMNVGYPSDGETSSGDSYLLDAGYTRANTEDRALFLWQANAMRLAANPQWQTPYRTVYLSNLVLENVEKFKGTTDQAVLDDMRGQALFFRAYNFWQIAQLYAQPYTAATAAQDLGIPLRLKSDINGISARGTVQDTYDRITGDLIEAASLLKPTSTVPSRPNRAAAFAMLARVYLSMDKYAEALSSASSALQLNSQLLDYNTRSTTSNNPFTRFNVETIFHSVMVGVTPLDPRSGNNDGAKIDLALATSYAPNDLRSRIFLKRNADNVTYRFTGNYEGATNSTYFTGLAVDELYLVRAECSARAGNATAAMADLNTLLRTRWATGTYTDMTASSADDALVKVLAERRKELLMRGLRWSDLRRLNRDSRFAVTLSRTISGTTYTLPPNDLRYTLLIPSNVIQTSGIAQNPR